MRLRTCSVTGCTDKTSPRHRFPHDELDLDVFDIWKSRCNHPRFGSLTNMQIYNTYRICQRHFTPDCIVRGTKNLKKRVVPTLFLPEYPTEEIIALKWPYEEQECVAVAGTSQEIVTPTSTPAKRQKLDIAAEIEQVQQPVPETSQCDTSTQQEKFVIQSGVNKEIFTAMKAIAAKLSVQDRVCSLIFDEIPIEPSLFYDVNRDVIVGFQDYTRNPLKPTIASHVLVFMLRGVKKKWKQPIGFTFCDTMLSRKSSVVSMIDAAQGAGYTVAATVCDHTKHNRAVIKALLLDTEKRCSKNGKENEYKGFLVTGNEIIPLFDVPHLLKDLRNNLLDKKLCFKLDGIEQNASWDHFIQLHLLNTDHDYLSIVSKLTEAHVYADSIKKMKVALAAQVFSRSVGSLLKLLAGYDYYGIDAGATQTAELCGFVDQLFDSLNARLQKTNRGKPLQFVATANTPHLEYWTKAVEIMKTFHFYTENASGQKIIVTLDSIKSWIFTLKNFIYIFKLLNGSGHKYLMTRNLNMDPLENFLDRIRSSNDDRNANPTAASFATSFDKLVMNDLPSSHSDLFNCEEDDCVYAISDFSDLVKRKTESNNFSGALPYLPPTLPTRGRSLSAKCARVFVRKYVAKKVYHITKDCMNCANRLCSFGRAPSDLEFNNCNEYTVEKLITSGTYFVHLVNEATAIIRHVLPDHCRLAGLSKFFTELLCANLRLDPIKCEQHPEVQSVFIKYIIRILVGAWCKSVTNIMMGKDELYIKYMKSTDKSKIQSDKIKMRAYEYYIARKEIETSQAI